SSRRRGGEPARRLDRRGGEAGLFSVRGEPARRYAGPIRKRCSFGGDIVGLTTLGLFRTAISLVAVVCGIWAFARYKKISLSNRLGQLCLASTLLTAVTALGIFQHGGAAARAGRAHARGADGRRQRGDPFGYS